MLSSDERRRPSVFWMRSEDEGEVDQQEAEQDVVAAEEVGEAVEVAVKVVVALCTLCLLPCKTPCSSGM